MKAIIRAVLIISSLIIGSAGYSDEGTAPFKVQKVDRKNNTVFVTGKGIDKIKIGQVLYIGTAHDVIVEISVTYPMMSFAKCRLSGDQSSIERIAIGQDVSTHKDWFDKKANIATVDLEKEPTDDEISAADPSAAYGVWTEFWNTKDSGSDKAGVMFKISPPKKGKRPVVEVLNAGNDIVIRKPLFIKGMFRMQYTVREKSGSTEWTALIRNGENILSHRGNIDINYVLYISKDGKVLSGNALLGDGTSIPVKWVKS